MEIDNIEELETILLYKKLRDLEDVTLKLSREGEIYRIDRQILLAV